MDVELLFFFARVSGAKSLIGFNYLHPSTIALYRSKEAYTDGKKRIIV